MYPTPPPPPSSLTQQPQASASHFIPSTPAYPNSLTNVNHVVQPPPSATTYAGHPGQPPTFPQPMPYTMGGAGTAQAQTPMANVNGSLSNQFVDLLKEKSVISPFAEDPPLSPLLTEDNQQMNCRQE